MSLAASTRSDGPFVAIAAQTDFACDFPAPNPAAINAQVLHAGVVTTITSNGIEILDSTDSGFTARLTTPCSAGDQVVVFSETPTGRSQTWISGRIDAAPLETDFNGVAMQVQELRRDLGASLSRPLIGGAYQAGGLPILGLPRGGGDPSGAVALAQVLDLLASMGGFMPQQVVLGSYTALRALEAVTSPVVFVLGNVIAGDGGEGVFRYDALDTVSGDNGGTVLRAAGVPGCFKRVYKGKAFAEWFGAKGDGVTDDGPAINAALGACANVELLDKHYGIGTTIQALNNASLVGAGMGQALLLSLRQNAPVVTIGASIGFWTMSDLHIFFAAPAAAGGDGIHQVPNTSVQQLVLERIFIFQAYNGVSLNQIVVGVLDGVRFENCVNDGFGMYLNDGQAGQADLFNCFAESNGRDGYHIECISIGGPGECVGPRLHNCKTFGNGRMGIAAIGLAASTLNDIQINGGFLGNAGVHEIYFNTYGGGHKIAPDMIELATEVGIYIDANNLRPLVQPGVISGCGWDGVYSVCTDDVAVVGGQIINCGTAGVAGHRNGVFAGNGGRISVVGVTAGNTGAGASQLYGFNTTLTDFTLSGCNFNHNATAPIVGAAGAAYTIAGCLPVAINH